MHITVDRVKSDGKATLSIVYINGKFECFGLEDRYREDKVKHETRIPAGTYKVGVRKVGGTTARYQQRFPEIHKGMLHVLNVPNFEYILIHCGNFHTDSSGCLLLGQDANTGEAIHIPDSKDAYVVFYQKVIKAALDGHLTITYKDSDRG